jgi:D-sedoheptulose 7-phosphate isomerase
MQELLAGYLGQSAEAAASLAADRQAHAALHRMARRLADALLSGHKLLLAGNGGSAADAQHLAAEFVSRLMFDRPALAALALSESGPILTACANDYGAATMFARQIQALGRKDDILLAFSTSGNSPNILEALDAAGLAGLVRFGFTGQAGGAMAERCDELLLVPAAQGQIVQQLHITAGHALLAAVEQMVFSQAKPA